MAPPPVCRSVAHAAAQAALVAVLVLHCAAAHADPVTPARHRLAVDANTSGLRFYRAGQLPRAAMRFRDATFFDPDYALAHYNLACVASRLREVSTAIAELSWLRASTDPVAQSRLDKARTDADLDFVSALPKVRELLGLAPFDPRQPLGWLSERHGTWSVELPTEDCPIRSYRLDVHTDGALDFTVNEACVGHPLRTHTFAGSTSVDGSGRVHLDVRDWPLWPAGARLTFTACPGLADAPGSCFTLATDDNEIGPFHRGAPGTSPMHPVGRAMAAAAR